MHVVTAETRGQSISMKAPFLIEEERYARGNW